MMNQMKNKPIILCLLFLLMGCGSMGRENMDLEELEERDRKFEEKMIKRRHPYYFYNAIYILNVDGVRRYIEAGANPNKCWGENGWVDSNPLKVITEGFYSTYDIRNHKIKDFTEPLPDVAIIKLLVNAGADINRLPYVWDSIYRWGNDNLSWRKDGVGEIDAFINDANRVLATLLEMGADPDKLGHPFPFSYDWKVPFLTDKKAHKYFAKGTRAINEAIEKGILWESQVDLLLQYTKLDEESLKAAERSNDPAMVEKINKLWETRQLLP
jgi:hypothetical protein